MSDVVLRPVRDADVFALFRWRNDETTRQFSGRRGRITWQEHARWFCDRYHGNWGWWFMATRADDESIIVGVVRIDKDDDRRWISITVAPEYRGFGYASAILERLDLLDLPPRPILARIHSENVASLKLFDAAGYRRRADLETSGTWQTWEKP